MNYPLISEYVEAIKSAEDNFATLTNLRPVFGEDGNPVMTSGNFAVVFKMRDEDSGKLYALKCFLKDQPNRAESYKMIADELEYVSSTFLVQFRYLDKELFVDTNNPDEGEFPVLLMDWVEGVTLDKYIRQNIDDQYALQMLAYRFSKLAMWIIPQPFAHGDIKPDNVMIRDDGTLVLIDYDGMYVPSMKGQKARELGSPDFRHPSRTEDDFDEHIDDFSLVSILLSLEAISIRPGLLDKYGAPDRLLFSDRDYSNISESVILDALKSLLNNKDLATIMSLFILAITQNNISQVTTRLLNISKPNKSFNVWKPYDEPYSLKDLWDVTDPGKYDRIKGYIADVIAVEYTNGNIGLRISIPFADGSYELLKVSCYSDLEEEDKVIISTITAQEFHKKGSKPIVRYDGEYISTEVTEDDLKSVWIDDIGVKYNKSRTRLLWAPKYIEHYHVRNGTFIICDKAFSECRKLQSVSLPNSVAFIGDFAFYNCSHLRSASIPNNVKCGMSIFEGCENLPDYQPFK